MTLEQDPSLLAADAVPAGDDVGIPSAVGLLGGLASTLLRGSSVAKASVGLGLEMVRITLGRSEVEPAGNDWRFKDPTWSANPLYKRLAQSYLAACLAVDKLLADVEAEGDRHRTERARFAMGIVTSALAPTNTLVGNPAALKKTFESGGSNLRAGLENFLRDVTKNGGMPAMATPGALQVGRDLAMTPGHVVDRDEVAEVLQYTATTKKVRERPMLVVPPPIGRYYFLDLSPGRSFVEYSVSQGLQTFLVSWRNPSREQSHWDIDTYAARVLRAIDAVREVTGSDDVNVVGFCAGGILNTALLNYLASESDTRIHSASYAVTLLDFGQSAPIGAFAGAKLLSIARWNSSREGVITARAMGSAFTWMRPNDLVWNYWVNNYLMGQDPPVFDILSWNADGTNLPAALHRQFLDIFQHNPLPRAGAMEALGVPIDLEQIKVPTYVTGAVNDHLTPWKSCYRTTQLLAGDCRFVLSNAGHIASLVNPPGNPKATYYTGALTDGESPEVWLEQAERQAGSWWEDWAAWAVERSGGQVAAPAGPGSAEHPPLEEGPGSYVRQQN